LITSLSFAQASSKSKTISTKKPTVKKLVVETSNKVVAESKMAVKKEENNKDIIVTDESSQLSNAVITDSEIEESKKNDLIKIILAAQDKIDEVVNSINAKKQNVLKNNPKISVTEKNKLDNEMDAIKKSQLVELLGEKGYLIYMNSNKK
jgi:hypothetical protein